MKMASLITEVIHGKIVPQLCNSRYRNPSAFSCNVTQCLFSINCSFKTFFCILCQPKCELNKKKTIILNNNKTVMHVSRGTLGLWRRTPVVSQQSSCKKKKKQPLAVIRVFGPGKKSRDGVQRKPSSRTGRNRWPSTNTASTLFEISSVSFTVSACVFLCDEIKSKLHCATVSIHQHMHSLCSVPPLDNSAVGCSGTTVKTAGAGREDKSAVIKRGPPSEKQRGNTDRETGSTAGAQSLFENTPWWVSHRCTNEEMGSSGSSKVVVLDKKLFCVRRQKNARRDMHDLRDTREWTLSSLAAATLDTKVWECVRVLRFYLRVSNVSRWVLHGCIGGTKCHLKRVDLRLLWLSQAVWSC